MCVGVVFSLANQLKCLYKPSHNTGSRHAILSGNRNGIVTNCIAGTGNRAIISGVVEQIWVKAVEVEVMKNAWQGHGQSISTCTEVY